MPLSFLLDVLGGLGLFILGMKAMSEGLNKFAGDNLRHLLERLTGNRLSAALLGSCLASFLQSSSAASIIIIGFVNAGLISLYQALCVLLGTGLGSTLVIQLIAFKISSLALPSIFLGVVLKLFCKRRRLVDLGEILSGIGLVFYGLYLMETGFSPISSQAIFSGVHTNFLTSKLSAVILGAILTLLIQSSSTTTGIVIALASSGLISFGTGVAMIIGEALGTSCITGIATINGTIAAKRTALLYFVINFAAISLTLIFFPIVLSCVQYISPGDAEYTLIAAGNLLRPNIARHLANAHTLFNIAIILIFLPLLGFFVRSATFIYTKKGKSIDLEPRTIYIDLRIINTPTIAMLQVKSEVQRMAEISRLMYKDIVEQLYRFDVRRAKKISDKEVVLDVLHKDISRYLIVLSRQPLSAEISMEIPIMLQVIDNLEHIGDQCELILGLLRKKKENKIYFSSAAIAELKYLAVKVREIVELSTEFVTNNSQKSFIDTRTLKDEIIDLKQTIFTSHMNRLTVGKCNILAGLVFNDITASFNKISDYSFSNIETEQSLINA